MELLDVIKRPVTTEESMLAVDGKKYTFEMDTHVNKTLIKQAVESAFDVKVANVNISNVRPEFEHTGKYAGYTKKHHKVIVTSTEDSKETQLFKAAR